MKSVLINGVEKKVGDLVYIPSTRNSREIELPITKIGTKYISVTQFSRADQFEIETGREKLAIGTPRYLYASKEDYDRMCYEGTIISKVEQYFSSYRSCNYEQAVKILEILGVK